MWFDIFVYSLSALFALACGMLVAMAVEGEGEPIWTRTVGVIAGVSFAFIVLAIMHI